MSNNRFEDLFRQADKAFDGKYKEELNGLSGLSAEEVDSITADTSDLRVYSVLIKVVENASKENLTKAQLVDDIKSLGDIAIKIAKKVPQLATLLN